uniref:heavy metal sensor histidine kinase n=1 Tax=Hylemonella sp. TaxID=2066020 RepID=UPI0035ADBB95
MKQKLTLSWGLALLLAGIVILSSGAIGVYLYHSFALQLERRDDILLMGKLRQLRQQLGDAATPELLFTHPQYLRDTMSGDSNALIEVTDSAGQVLLSVNPSQEALPFLAPLDESSEPTSEALLRWRARDGSPAGLVAGYARLGHPEGRRVKIAVARVYSERAALLTAHRWRIAASVIVAALSAALLSGWLAWRALSPLRRLSVEAAQINVDRLSARLSEDGAPVEIKRLIETLNTMLTRLEDGFARLSRFAADLAHEFRTPVGNMLGQSQVLLTRPREMHEYQTLIESNIEELERLARMIDSMLFLARAEHAELALNLQPVCIRAELERQADYFEDLAQERGLTLVARGAGTLQADPALLRRALANLVSNAVRYTRPGSVIDLSAVSDEHGWLLAVENDGEPLPAEVLDRMFDRFYRVGGAPSESGRSSGLGLAIVRSIMTLHGGEARVSQSGSRLSFTLFFPDASSAGRA